MSEVERSQRSFPRRDFIRLGIGAFAVFTVPISFVNRQRLARRSIPVMGTIADFAVVHRTGNDRYAQDAIDEAIAELRLVERTMSWFNSGSDVGRANLYAAKGFDHFFAA